MAAFWMLLSMLVGFGVHVLMKTYERDRDVSERRVTPLEVYWDGPERWRTLATLVLIGVLAFTDSTATLFSLLGITVGDVTDAWLLFVVIGYNIDSLGQKVLSLGQKKAKEG